jgi:hypothetical protein
MSLSPPLSSHPKHSSRVRTTADIGKVSVKNNGFSKQ